MSATYLPATHEIVDLVREDTSSRGGEVTDVIDDGRRLFVRTILPHTFYARAGDRLQGGIALRTVGPDILVHPYIFREVCTNGAIAAYARETRHVARVEAPASEYSVIEALNELREAIHINGSIEASREVVDDMQAATRASVKLALTFLSMLPGFPKDVADEIRQRVLDQFTSAGDESVYGLMNAVTAVARERRRDSEQRWELEKIGASLLANIRRDRRAAPRVAAEVPLDAGSRGPRVAIR